jgi:glycosyltransferase involved in cell wall biosynthesis
MNTCEVSVIIPTFNYADYVGDAIESVIAQSCAAKEIIVVDDGSTDDTRARVSSFGAKVKYVYQRNGGISSARNTGIGLATGDIIAFLDSDDTWHPRKLEEQVRVANDQPECGLIASESTLADPPVWGGSDSARVIPITLEQLIRRGRFSPSSVLVRRKCFEHVGRFDVRHGPAADRDMWIRIAAKYPVALLSTPLCWYRLHGNNMSKAAAAMERDELAVLRKAFDTIPELAGRAALRRQSISWVYYSSAFEYEARGAPWTALERTLRSALVWPFGLGGDRHLLHRIFVQGCRMVGMRRR